MSCRQPQGTRTHNSRRLDCLYRNGRKKYSSCAAAAANQNLNWKIRLESIPSTQSVSQSVNQSINSHPLQTMQPWPVVRCHSGYNITFSGSTSNRLTPKIPSSAQTRARVLPPRWCCLATGCACSVTRHTHTHTHAHARTNTKTGTDTDTDKDTDVNQNSTASPKSIRTW